MSLSFTTRRAVHVFYGIKVLESKFFSPDYKLWFWTGTQNHTLADLQEAESETRDK